MPGVQDLSNLAGTGQAYLYDGSGYVIFDVMPTKTVNKTNQVTAHAIEDGSDIADHVINKPDAVPVTAILSDEISSVQGIGSAIASAPGAAGLNNVPGIPVMLTIEQRLIRLHTWNRKKTLLSFYGNADYYDDMVNVIIENMSEVQSSETGTAIKITFNLKQLTIALAGTSAIGAPQVNGQTQPITQQLRSSDRGQSRLLQMAP